MRVYVAARPLAWPRVGSSFPPANPPVVYTYTYVYLPPLRAPSMHDVA